jgi:type I restriction enzyme S subunit
MKSWKASEFCKKIFDGTHESPKYVKFGKKLITSKYISSGLDLDHAPFISENDFSLISQRSKVEKMDVLFSMIGTVGTTYLVRQDPDYAIKNIGVFRAKTPIDAEYLFYFFQSPHFQHSLKGNLVGSTQKFLGLNQLKQLEISVPENIGEERHIVDTTSSRQQESF